MLAAKTSSFSSTHSQDTSIYSWEKEEKSTVPYCKYVLHVRIHYIYKEDFLKHKVIFENERKQVLHVISDINQEIIL